MHSKPKTIAQYINKFPAKIRSILNLLKNAIKVTAPKASEKISYDMPTFTLNGKNLVHFAAFKNHIGFYPTPKPIVKFKKELKEYKTSKGAVQFPINKPLPFGLIKRMIKYKIKTLVNGKSAKK